jgi:hypothetical protein
MHRVIRCILAFAFMSLAYESSRRRPYGSLSTRQYRAIVSAINAARRFTNSLEYPLISQLIIPYERTHSAVIVGLQPALLAG